MRSLIFVAACRIFSCGMWGPVPCPEIEPRPPALGAWSLSNRTTREVPSKKIWSLLHLGNRFSCKSISWLQGQILRKRALVGPLVRCHWKSNQLCPTERSHVMDAYIWDHSEQAEFLAPYDQSFQWTRSQPCSWMSSTLETVGTFIPHGGPKRHMINFWNWPSEVHSKSTDKKGPIKVSQASFYASCPAHQVTGDRAI